MNRVAPYEVDPAERCGMGHEVQKNPTGRIRRKENQDKDPDLFVFDFPFLL